MSCETGGVHCTKHEGAGNDFLVVLDPDDTLRLRGDQMRLLCDRHRGIGADGLIRVVPGREGASVGMKLHNADGSAAEMSGNGIRCLAQAAVEAGLVAPPTFSVSTAGGVRTVTFVPGEERGRARASVDMGPVTVGPDVPPVEGRAARTVDVGNPHLVLLGPSVAAVDIALRGPALQSEYAEGINVEWIEVVDDDQGPLLELRVWERGAGETLACGTGSVAAAAAARDWGVLPESGAASGPGPATVAGTVRVRVRNPGGTLEVDLGPGAGDPAVLAGPVRKVADIDIDPGMLS